jgi:hypothetical protein
MGKWSKDTVAEHQGRLDPIVAECNKLPNEKLAEAYAGYRKYKEEVEAKLSNINDHIRAAEMVFAERFAESDVKTMKFNNGLSLTITLEQGYVFKDKEKFIKFLEDNGWHHELTVPANSLNRLMRDLVEEKLDPPGVELGEPYTKFSARGLK